MAEWSHGRDGEDYFFERFQKGFDRGVVLFEEPSSCNQKVVGIDAAYFDEFGFGKG
jgi:hypothetical protein